MKTKLNEYIVANTLMRDRKDTEFDLVFFGVDVLAVNNNELLEVLMPVMLQEGLNLCDGEEHSYIEIAAVITGDQGLAMRLMALGDALGIWQLLTPKTVLGDLADEEMKKLAAGQGLITIKAKHAL